MKSPRQQWHVRSVGVLEKFEDGIYLVVAGLLVLGAIFMLWSALVGFYQDLIRTQSPFTVVIDLLDKGLLVFIIAELLHTVRITIQERTLVAEPFLIGRPHCRDPPPPDSDRAGGPVPQFVSLEPAGH